MNSIRIGRTPLTGSRLAYGCWRLAGSEGELPPADVATTGIRAVQAAADAGFTLFDLADIYGGGESERIFGRALAEMPGLRDRLVVASKCGIRKAGDPRPDSPYRYDFSARHIVASVEGSLRRMGIEHLDVLMLHRPDVLMDPAEVAGAFLQLRDAGKVREFGVSNFRPSQVTALQRAVPFPLAVHQFEASLHQLASLDDGTLDQCLSTDLTAMAWSPLDKGRLGSLPPIAGGAADGDPRCRLRPILDAMAADHGVSRPVMALAWLLRHPARMIPVIGTTRPERIRELVRAESVQIERDAWYRLLETARGFRLP
jgi:predicted oxidoreductase